MASFDELFALAEDSEDKGALYDALECWRRVVTLRPDPAAYCRLAQVAMDLDLKEEAENALNAALELDNEIASAYTGLASLKMQSKDPKLAVDLLLKALEFEKCPSTYTLLGSALMDLGEDGQAAESYTKALALDPEYEEAYYNLGVVYRTSDPVKAEALFRKALELDAEYASAHRELGFLLLKTKDIENAEYQLRRAKELEPENMWGRIYLGNLLWQRGDFTKAREEFVAAVLLAPNLGQPRFFLANLVEAQGELDEAEKLYKEALQLDPADAETLAKLAGVFVAKGDTSSAKMYASRSLKIDPQNRTAKRVIEQAC